MLLVFSRACESEPVVGMPVYIVESIHRIAYEESDLDRFVEDIGFGITLGVAVRPASEVPEESPVIVVVCRQESSRRIVPEVSAAGFVSHGPESGIRAAILFTVALLPYGIEDCICRRDKDLALPVDPAFEGIFPAGKLVAGLYDISVVS